MVSWRRHPLGSEGHTLGTGRQVVASARAGRRRQQQPPPRRRPGRPTVVPLPSRRRERRGGGGGEKRPKRTKLSHQFKTQARAQVGAGTPLVAGHASGASAADEPGPREIITSAARSRRPQSIVLAPRAAPKRRRTGGRPRPPADPLGARRPGGSALARPLERPHAGWPARHSAQGTDLPRASGHDDGDDGQQSARAADISQLRLISRQPRRGRHLRRPRGTRTTSGSSREIPHRPD